MAPSTANKLSSNWPWLAISLLTFYVGVFIGSDDSYPSVHQPDNYDRRCRLSDPRTVELRPPGPDNGEVVAMTDSSSSNGLESTSDSSQPQQEGRDVHVGNMCRCGGTGMPFLARPDPTSTPFDTQIVQYPSKATGPQSKHYYMHASNCECKQGLVPKTHDKYMHKMPRARCSKQNPTRYDWGAMPDFGVEELPVFLSSLSFESPLPLNASLHNYLRNDIHRRIGIVDHFIQLNHRSEQDDAVIAEYQANLQKLDLPPATVFGSPDENLHPGLAIAKSCRAAEDHPFGHPNGENLLLFLEKDWSFIDPVDTDGDGKLNAGYNTHRLEDLFRSINALAQRGVPYIRLRTKLCGKNGCAETYKCPSQGVMWECTRSSEQRWSNQPFVVDCKWFLRYLEPFALLGIDDGIMMGCREGMQEGKYCDWEEALQDGRISWIENQWTTAMLPDKPCDDSGHCYDSRMFFHHEEGGK